MLWIWWKGDVPARWVAGGWVQGGAWESYEAMKLAEWDATAAPAVFSPLLVFKGPILHSLSDLYFSSRTWMKKPHSKCDQKAFNRTPEKLHLLALCLQHPDKTCACLDPWNGCKRSRNKLKHQEVHWAKFRTGRVVVSNLGEATEFQTAQTNQE